MHHSSPRRTPNRRRPPAPANPANSAEAARTQPGHTPCPSPSLCNHLTSSLLHTHTSMPRILRVAAAQVGRIDRSTPRPEILARLISLLEVSLSAWLQSVHIFNTDSSLLHSKLPPKRSTSPSSPRRRSRPSSHGTLSSQTPSWRPTLKRNHSRVSRSASRSRCSLTRRGRFGWMS